MSTKTQEELAMLAEGGPVSEIFFFVVRCSFVPSTFFSFFFHRCGVHTVF